MKKTKIIYWTSTGLFAFSILGSAIPSALSLPYAVEHFTKVLGYPAYFLPFTGFAKLLGLIALFIPKYPRVKEWVYAGFVFDLIAAIYSGVCVGGATAYLLPPLIALILLVVSYLSFQRTGNGHGAASSNRISLANS
jgi:hypothetical protein